MAEMARMTAAQLADKLLSEEHADLVRESVAWMAAQLMEAEVTARIGAERAPDRLAHRNGYRPRAWDTRVGSVELAIPKLRQGSYFPSFLQPRRRAEQALVAVVQEAYVNGISTRKVDRLVEQLGVAGMSNNQVSRLCRGLDEQVRIFRERPLEGAYPYVWLDAKVERVREPGVGGVRHKALVIASSRRGPRRRRGANDRDGAEPRMTGRGRSTHLRRFRHQIVSEPARAGCQRHQDFPVVADSWAHGRTAAHRSDGFPTLDSVCAPGDPSGDPGSDRPQTLASV